LAGTAQLVLACTVISLQEKSLLALQLLAVVVLIT
jgi:hypothetical protein